MNISEPLKGKLDLCKDIKEFFGDKEFTFVEIGSYSGGSASIFAEQFPNAKIICIDPWLAGFDLADPCSYANYSQVEKEFDETVKPFKNIEKKKGYSTDFNIECDIVFIDGRHYYEGVKEDILHWSPNVKRPGIIAGHDYCKPGDAMYQHSHIRNVSKAVDEILGVPDKRYVDGNWLKYVN